MKKKLSFLSLLLFLSFPGYSQECSERLSFHSSMFGIGEMNVYDSYLSPSEFSGMSFGFMDESLKMTKLLNEKIVSQGIFNINFASVINESQTTKEYAGFIEYTYGLFYKFKPLSELRFFVGSQVEGAGGFIYNSRNGNNPASAKATLNLTASAILSYDFSLKSQPFRICYQFSTPYAGIIFSPHYGQSYYEISLGDDDGIIHFASFHNQLAMKNRFSFEIPFNKCTLRLMYANSIYETQVNNIDTRVVNNSFMIGFSKEVFSVSGKKQFKGKYKSVFD